MATYGIEHYLPSLEKKMRLARRSLRGWDNKRPPLSHPPLNWSLTTLIAMELGRMGHPGAGVAVLLGFDCCLRILEIAALEARDISNMWLHDAATGKAIEAAGKTTAIPVSIRDSKTGRNQSVPIRRFAVGRLVEQWVGSSQRRHS